MEKVYLMSCLLKMERISPRTASCRSFFSVFLAMNRHQLWPRVSHVTYVSTLALFWKPIIRLKRPGSNRRSLHFFTAIFADISV